MTIRRLRGTIGAENNLKDRGDDPMNLKEAFRYQNKLQSLYYRVVVIRAPLQGLCYNVRDAVDWFSRPTARRFQKGSNHSPLQYC